MATEELICKPSEFLSKFRALLLSFRDLEKAIELVGLLKSNLKNFMVVEAKAAAKDFFCDFHGGCKLVTVFNYHEQF
jgi:hypothetical protein